MKKLFTILLLTILGATAAHAQCDDIEVYLIDPDSPSNVYTAPFQFDFCTTTLPFVLRGNKDGGVFNGLGVVSDSIFNPLTGGGSYQIIYSAPGCTDYFVEIKLIAPSAIPELNELPNFICENAEAFEIQGNVDADATVKINDVFTNIFNPLTLGPGLHRIEYIYIDPDVTNGCVAIDKDSISVVALPDMEIIGLKKVYCITDPPEQWTLHTPTGTSTLIAPGLSLNGIFDPRQAGEGTHIITHNYRNFSGICETTLIEEIEILPELAVEVTSAGSACYTETDTLVYSGQELPDTAVLAWSIKEEDGFLVYQEGNKAVVEWASPGDKEVGLAISNISCDGNYTYEVTKVGVEVVIEAQDQVVNSNTPVSIPVKATSNHLAAQFTYAWSPSTGLSCDACDNPVALIDETTTYTVTVTDENGCSATDEITLTLSSGNVFIPNIFTPNADGRNDELHVLGQGIASLTFTIYDRWGEQVFETTDKSIGWDGTHRGRALNTGLYFYTADIVFEDGSTVVKKGNVSLIR